MLCISPESHIFVAPVFPKTHANTPRSTNVHTLLCIVSLMPPLFLRSISCDAHHDYYSAIKSIFKSNQLSIALSFESVEAPTNFLFDQRVVTKFYGKYWYCNKECHFEGSSYRPAFVNLENVPSCGCCKLYIYSITVNFHL